MDDFSSESDGVVVLDSDYRAIFSSGIALNQDVARALAKRTTPTASRSMETFAVGGRKYIALVRRSSTHHVYLIHEVDDEDALFDFVNNVNFAYSVLNHFVCSPFEAMAVVDADERLRYLSPVHANSLGLSPGEGIGKHVREVIKNTGLPAVVQSGKAEIGVVMEIKDNKRIVSRVPIMKEGKVVGAIGQMMFKGPEQLYALSREVSRLRSEVSFYQRELSVIQSRSYGLEHIVGNSEVIRELKSQIARIAPLDVPVLILGESGTGKELVANAIHHLSNRRDRAMVPINAAAMPPALVESELFGYEAGAFTGAERKGRKGKFELADKSTLFLDEIGDMPSDVQIKLLRVLQDGMFERIGSDRPRHSDFRLITATNRDLKGLLEANQFRLDLYYRISSVTLRVPPLSERLEDIPLLVDNFMQAYCRRHHANLKRIHKDVCPYLQSLSWPGNLRQLLHEVEKALIFCDGDELKPSDFGQVSEKLPESPVGAESLSGPLPNTLERAELNLIKEALVRHRGNKSRVASELGISRSYLYKKLASMVPQHTTASAPGERRRQPEARGSQG